MRQEFQKVSELYIFTQAYLFISKYIVMSSNRSWNCLLFQSL